MRRPGAANRDKISRRRRSGAEVELGAVDHLDDAAAEVAATGGAGLDPATLSDLFLYRAWAMARVDFNIAHLPSPTTRAQAYAELTRAAALAPDRQLNPQQFPPLLVEDWARAVADVRARPQTTLIVRAAPEAQVSCDGGPPVPGPATFVGVAPAEHLIHIEEAGWVGWVRRSSPMDPGSSSRCRRVARWRWRTPRPPRTRAAWAPSLP